MEMIFRRNRLRKDSTVSKTIEMEAGGYRQRGMHSWSREERENEGMKIKRSNDSRVNNFFPPPPGIQWIQRK